MTASFHHSTSLPNNSCNFSRSIRGTVQPSCHDNVRARGAPGSLSSGSSFCPPCDTSQANRCHQWPLVVTAQNAAAQSLSHQWVQGDVSRPRQSFFWVDSREEKQQQVGHCTCCLWIFGWRRFWPISERHSYFTETQCGALMERKTWGSTL